MPIIAESGPLTFGGNGGTTPAPSLTPPSTPPLTPPTQSPYTQPTTTTAEEFTFRHQEFINQLNTLGSCFRKEQIKNFTSEECDQHIVVAEIDKYITKLKNQDGVFCTEQSAKDIETILKRYYV